MILEYKKYVSDEFVDDVRNQVLPFLKQGNKPVAYNRDGISVYITDLATEKEELKQLDQKLSVMFTKLSADVVRKRFRPQFSSGDSGYEYHMYEPGDICHYHSDGEVDRNYIRYASVVLFLTDNDDGELVFPTQNIEIKPEKGKLVVFPPYGMFSHYSKPSKKNREILMTWFVYNDVTVNINAT